MRSFRLLASLTLAVGLLGANVVNAGAVAYRRIDAVSFSDSTHGWISGGRDPRTGFVSYTEDGGTTWHTYTQPNRWFYGVGQDGVDGGWAVSNSQNYILRSTDKGATWTQAGPMLPSDGDGFEMRNVVKLGSRIIVAGQHKNVSIDGYARGDLAALASSTDGGNTWSTQYRGPLYAAADEFTDPPMALSEFVDVDGLSDGLTAMVAGNEWNRSVADGSKLSLKTPIIRKTLDGGSTWTTVTPPADVTAYSAVTDIAVGSPSVAWMAASTRILARTTNGSTWAQFRMPRRSAPYSSPSAIALDAWDEDTLLVGGTGGFVAWSDNAKLAVGDSPTQTDWTYKTVPGAGNINAVQVLSDTSAIVVGDEELIARTEDRGNTWTPMPAGPPTAGITGPGAGFPLTLTPMTISGTASDVGVGVEEVEVRIRRADGKCYDGLGNWIATDTWLNAQTSDRWDHWSYSWTPNMELLLSGQMVTLSARATDGAGLSATSAGVSSGVAMSASVSLAGGNPYTTGSPVTASIAANGATHMQWRVNDGAYNAWQPYSTTASVALPGGDGTKTVDFQFSTNGGANVAGAASDSIVLHTSIPTVAITSPSSGFGTLAPISITGTAADVGGTVGSVQVRIRRADGQSWNGTAWTGSDTWLNAATANGFANWSYNWTPSGVGDQIVTINARATDMAGIPNTSLGVSSSGPVTASISLADGATYTSTTSISAAVSASGVTHMRWRVNGGAYNAWQPYATTAAITLPSGDGTKTVDFEFSADGGSTAAGTATDSVVLHTTIPSVSVGKPSSGFRLSLAPVTIEGSATDVGLSVETVELLIRRADGQTWNESTDSWVDGNAWFSVPLTGDSWSHEWAPGVAAVESGDLVTVFARATDASGLSAATAGLTSGGPIRATASLAGGETFTSTRTVAASVEATPLAWMRYTVAGGSPSAWSLYSDASQVELSGAEGTKTVTFEFASEDGGVPAARTDDAIFLDVTNPIVAMSAPTGGFSLSSSPVVVHGTAADLGTASGLAGVEVRITRGGEYWNGFGGWHGIETWLPADVAGQNWSYTWIVDALTSGGHLPVTVTVRSRDRAGNYSSEYSVNSLDPLDKTAVTLTSTSKSLAYGGTGYVSGALTLLGEPYANRTVTLQTGTSSSTLKDTTVKRTTDANGKFSFAVKPSSKTYYRVSFVGSGGIASSKSGYIAYTPKAYLSTPVAPSSVQRNVAFTSYGYIKPRHAAGSYPVRIYLYRYVNGSYVYYRYVNAKAYNYSTYTKYSAAVKLPYAGKWRIRAYHSDSGHAATTSSYRYVTAR